MTATDMTTGMPAGENAEKVTERELLPIASGRQTWKWLRAALAEHRMQSLLVLIVAASASAMALVPIYVFGVLVDRVRDNAPTSTIVGVVVIIAAAAIVGGVFTGVAAYLIKRLGETILADLRERTVDRALRLPIQTVEKVGKGDLLSRVGDDVSVIAKAVSDVVPGMIAAVLLVALSMVTMLGLDWRLGLAGMVALPMYALALKWYLPRSAPVYAAERVAMGARSQALISSLQGVKTVRAYSLEKEHLGQIDAASAKARDLAVGVFGLFTRFAGRGNRAEFVGLSMILVVGFLLVREDVVTVGQTTTAALLFHRLLNPIGSLLYTFDEVQSAGASLARLVGVVEIEETEPSTDAGSVPADGSLRLDDIRHSYDGGHEVLHGVTLNLRAGERVALVGSTGAGKNDACGDRCRFDHSDVGAGVDRGCPACRPRRPTTPHRDRESGGPRFCRTPDRGSEIGGSRILGRGRSRGTADSRRIRVGGGSRRGNADRRR